MRFSPRAILAIDISPFGSSLTVLPAIRLIRDRFPGASLTAAASSGTCELLLDIGVVQEAIDVGVVKDSSEGPGRFFRTLYKLTRLRRRSSFDLVLDFSARYEPLIAFLFGSRSRVLAPRGQPLLTSLIFGRRARTAARPTRYALLLRQLGIEAPDLKPELRPRAEYSAGFEQVLTRHGCRGGEPLVLIYASDAGASGWPPDRYVEIASRLARNFGCRIIAVDVPGDGAFTGRIGALLPEGAISLSAPRAIEVLAACARASLLLTDDAGLAGLAVGLRTPVIELTDDTPSGGGHLYVRLASDATPDQVYAPACELLQGSRTESLFHH